MPHTKFIPDFFKVCSILPALVILPAMADVITEQTIIKDAEKPIIIDTQNTYTVTTPDRDTYRGAIINYGTPLTFNNLVTFDGNIGGNYGGGGYHGMNTSVVAFNKFAEFKNNKAFTGAAIQIEKDSAAAFFDGVTFDSNTGDYGGALYNFGTTHVYGDAIFKNNVVTGATKNAGSGAAVNNIGTLAMDAGNGAIEFTDNVAYSNAGAIQNGNNASVATLTGKSIKFSGNVAQHSHGGAIYNQGKMDILGDKNEFIGNHADEYTDNVADNNKNNDVHMGGGAIQNRGTGQTAIVIGKTDGKSENEFTENYAKMNGGAILNRSQATMTFNGKTTFAGNYTEMYDGGAIYNFAEKGNPSIVFNGAVDFNGNKALAGNGGAIWNGTDGTDGASAVITFKDKVSFSNNKAEFGGAIYNDVGGALEINNGQFNENIATTGRGGAVYNGGALSLSGGVFARNESKDQGYGGAIFNDCGLLTLNSVIFNNNVAAWDGGAISSATTSIAAHNKPADYNGNDFSTSAVREYWESKNGFGASNKMVINNSRFSGNKASEYSGGALGIYSDAEINRSYFVGNNAGGHEPVDATDGGGAIYAGGWARVDIKNTNFIRNTSNYGGAIATSRAGVTDDAYLNIENGLFRDNGATKSGGAISNHFDNVVIKNSTFTSNNASVSGGAIYNDGTIDFVGNNTFSENTLGMPAGVNRPSTLVGNDIHNVGTLNLTSASITNIGSGISGAGTLNLENGAVLNLGTAKVEQGTLNLAGVINTSIIDNRSYGRLFAENYVINGGTMNLRVGSAGVYEIFNGDVSGLNINAGATYIAKANADGKVIIETKAVDELAADAGISISAATTVAALANSTDRTMAIMSLRAQDALNAGHLDYVEAETGKVNPDDKPVAHSVASSVQNQVLSLVAGRMAGAAGIGRAGGDVRPDYGFWGHGLFNKSKYSDQFHSYTRGIALGVDALIDRKYTIGAGYAINSTDVHSNDRSSDVSSGTLFVYGQYKPNKWYMNAALSYTMSEYTERISVFGAAFTSDHDVNSFGGQIMTGYDFATGITPEIGVRYLHVSTDDYNNGLAQVRSDDADFVSGIAGLKYAFSINSNTVVKWRPELRAAATYDFVSDDNTATVLIPGASPYIVAGENLSKLGGEFGIGLTALYKGLEISLNYDLDLHEHYTSQTGMLKFKVNF